jgi:hypothetical protein
MAHKYCFEALDTTMKDIMNKHNNNSQIFGGKVVVFGGNFRQILPVVPRGKRSDIVHSSINSSYIWDHVQVLTLTKNMRLKCGSSPAEQHEMTEFSRWLLQVGEGKIVEPNDGVVDIQIPDDFLIKNFDDPIVGIINSTYPAFEQNCDDYDYLSQRAILASTIEVVNKINDVVLQQLPGNAYDFNTINFHLLNQIVLIESYFFYFICR